MQLNYINPKAPVFYSPSGERMVIPLDPPVVGSGVNDLTSCTFRSEQFSASVMADLGFSSMQGKTDSKYDFYMFAISLVDPVLRMETVQDGSRVFEYGTAIRVGISVLRTETSASLGLAGLSASATLSAASSSVEAQFLGMDLQLSTELSEYIPLGSSFNATMMNSIGQMTVQFQSDLVAHPAWIMPDRLASSAPLPAPRIDYLQAISAAYALHRLTKGDDLQDALDRLAKKVSSNDRDYAYAQVNPTLVRALYYQISGGYPDDNPTSETKQKAHEIYDNTTTT